jgi:hypothetical protein
MGYLITGSYVTGSYNFDHHGLPTLPTQAHWVPLEQLDVDGNGHPIYPTVHEFELQWSAMWIADFDALVHLCENMTSTGTVVSTLPEYHANDYQYFNYSGTILQLPKPGQYFEGYILNTTMVISNVRV